MGDVNPLSIILVKNGSRGDRLLFRYPFNTTDNDQKAKVTVDKKVNPYSLMIEEDFLNTTSHYSSNICDGNLVGFSDKVMSNLFAVKGNLCSRKFELKVNDVRFVGHPTNLPQHKLSSQSNLTNKSSEKRKSSTIVLFNIVFALRVALNHDIVNCYHDLSRRLSIALCHEEKRNGFLSREAKLMLAIQDEASQQPEDAQKSPFQQILAESRLAQELHAVYDGLCSTGIVEVSINKWIKVSFCLPQKVHQSLSARPCTDKQSLVLKSQKKLKPYHTLLLLEDRSVLLRKLGPDASPALRRLLHVAFPTNPFYTLAADADLTLSQVFQLSIHLVYWGKASIIYPLCSTNTYVLSHEASISIQHRLCDEFTEQFPGHYLHNTLAEFSLPISLKDKCNPINFPHEQQIDVQQVLWLLKYELLHQLHTYVYLVIPATAAPSTNSLPTTGVKTFAPSTYSSTGSTTPVVQPYYTDETTTDVSANINSHSSKNLLNIRNFSNHYNSNEFINLTGHRLLSNVLPTVNEPNVVNDPPSQCNNDATITYDTNTDHNNYNLHHQTPLISHTPSESDPGSVCSDERSPSPGLSAGSALSEASVSHLLSTQLSAVEKAYITKMEVAHNLEDLKLFAKLCQYFRGKHPLEDIMYRANLTRSHLLELLDKFHEVLITCCHPEECETA